MSFSGTFAAKGITSSKANRRDITSDSPALGVLYVVYKISKQGSDYNAPTPRLAALLRKVSALKIHSNIVGTCVSFIGVSPGHYDSSAICRLMLR